MLFAVTSRTPLLSSIRTQHPKPTSANCEALMASPALLPGLTCLCNLHHRRAPFLDPSPSSSYSACSIKFFSFLVRPAKAMTVFSKTSTLNKSKLRVSAIPSYARAELDAVNIAEDVTQVCCLFSSYYMGQFFFWVVF